MLIKENILNKKNKRNIVFEIIASEWLKIKEKEVKKSTFSNYLYIIKKYLICEFGNMKIEKLEKNDFNKYIDILSKKLKSKTIKDIIIILKAILNYSNEKYNSNIKTQKIKPPKLNQDVLQILNREEKEKLTKYCVKENSFKSIGIIICLNTGLRIGEICALRFKDIDLDKKEIFIKNTLQRIYDSTLEKTKIIIDEPKTKSSVRCIPISNKLYNIIKKVSDNHNENDFFLTCNERRYIEPRIYREYFKKVLIKSKIKYPYKFHALRHTFATECIDVGMDAKSLSEILGHANVDITLNRYVHSSYERKKKYLEKL